MGKGFNFRPIDVFDSEIVLNWRTSPRVTQYMITDIEYDLDAQTEWIKSLKTRFDYYVWIIQLNKIPIGVINITDIDYDNFSCSWGYYIGNDEYLGHGGFVPPYVYNFVFNNLNFVIVNIKVFSENISVINLHLKLGYELNPFFDELIIKNNIQINLIGMSLHVNKWNVGRYKNFCSNLKLEK